MSSCSHFFKLLASLGYDLHTLSVGELADLLQVSSLSKSSDPSACGGKGLLKALRWLANVAMVTSLQALTYHQVINAFIVAKHIKDRQETAPFCLWLLYQFERRILQRSATHFEVAFLGATLVCIFGGLRFADSQRLPLRSLIIDASSLRGVCDRTKTSHHGQPWGLLISGLLSLGSFTWVSKYLMVLDELWHRSGLESIDYLFFTLNGDSISPMSYSEALKTLRYYIQCPWKSEQTSGVAGINFTMHSMKTTLLAWAIQVPGISDDMRLVQGHHRGRSSLRTYSRDGVFLQLRLQSILIDAIRTGFRPQMAQHRGAQSPLVEPAVTIELFNKKWSPPTWRMFSFPTISTTIADPEPTSIEESLDELISYDESTSSSSSSSDSSSDSDVDRDKTKDPPKQDTPDVPDVIVLGHVSSIQHALIPTLDTSYPMFDRHHFKSACGVKLNPDTCVIREEILPKLQLCQRQACRKLWISLA